MTLTKAVIDKAEAPERDQAFIRDDQTRGLALRITAGGSKTFVFEGRFRGRVRRVTLGAWPIMTVGAARDAVAKCRANIADGIDPGEARRDARREPTFGDLVDAYLADAEARGRRSLPDMRARVAAHLSPWRNRQASDITPADVAQLHQTIGKTRPVLANRTAILLVRAIYGHAIKLRTFKGENPAAHIEPFAEQSRERFLSPAELERVNAELAAEPHPYWKAYFTALLMLGLRRDELLAARWADIDLDARTLRLPMTKNGKSHVLPVPEAVLRMLCDLPSFELRAMGNGWVFKSSAAKCGHLTDPQGAWERIRVRAGVPDVRIHDLRRSLGSWLAGAGFSLPMIGRALNHQSASSTQIYARLALDPVREMLEKNAALMLGNDRG